MSQIATQNTGNLAKFRLTIRKYGKKMSAEKLKMMAYFKNKNNKNLFCFLPEKC